MSISDIQDVPAVDIAETLPKTSVGVYRTGGKRVLDISLVMISIPVIAPILLFLAALIALDGGKPFYSQQRVGKGGRNFTLWKLRSMVPNAEIELEHYLQQNPKARTEWDKNQKLVDDPRITRMGKLIRKSSLDELPQLWNVLCGDMSLVGPRPMLPEQQHLYPGTDYYTLRPGITGRWQVTSRNESSFSDRAAFDKSYNSDLTLWADIFLLIATVNVVLRGTGK